MTHLCIRFKYYRCTIASLTQLIPWLSDSNVSHFAVLSVLVISVQFLEVAKCATRVQALGACQGAEADLIAFAELHVTT